MMNDERLDALDVSSFGRSFRAWRCRLQIARARHGIRLRSLQSLQWVVYGGKERCPGFDTER